MSNRGRVSNPVSNRVGGTEHPLPIPRECVLSRVASVPTGTTTLTSRTIIMNRTTTPLRVRLAAAGTTAALAGALVLGAAAPAQALPPVGSPDSYTVAAGSTLSVPAPGVLANDNDPDSNFFVSGYTTPAHGTMSLNQSTGALTYTPNAGFSGSDTFDYYLGDFTDVVGPVTVTIQVQGAAPVTQPPVAVDDSYTVDNTTPASFAAPGFLSNDSDPDSGFSVANVGSVSHGQLAWLPTGSFSYEADAGYVGMDSFTYRLTDPDGNLSDWATVTFDVQQGAPVNGVPVAVDDAYSVVLGTPLVVAAPGLLANDSDPDGDPVSVGGVYLPAGGLLAGESLVESADGGFTYTAPSGYTGVRTFTYQAFDGVALSAPPHAQIVFTISAPAANNVPVATADAYDVLVDTTLTVGMPGVLGNDSDADADPLSVVLTADPVGGALPGESLTLLADGSFQYAPPTGFAGMRTWSYVASDGQDDAASVDVVFTIAPPNTPPVAVADAYTVLAETPLVVTAPGLWANDSDADGDSWGYASLVEPPLNALPGESLDISAGGGAFTYTPPTGYTGTRVWGYAIQDATGASSIVDITFTVQAVLPPNAAPTAVDDAYATLAGAPLPITAPGLLGNDVDTDADPLAVAQVTAPAGGALAGESLAWNADGSFLYTPPIGFTGVRTWTYEATDGTDTSGSAAIVITVQSLPGTQLPTSSNDPGADSGSGTGTTGGGSSGSLAATGSDSVFLVGVLAILLVAVGVLLRRGSRREA